MKKRKRKRKQRMQEVFTTLEKFRSSLRNFSARCEFSQEPAKFRSPLRNFIGPCFQNWYQTSIGHNVLVRTLIRTFLDSAEIYLSL